MVNINISFPDDLREQAESAARERGLALDEFVRLCVSNSVAQNAATDPLFADRQVFVGEAPADLAREHDHYLYETDK